MGHEDEGIERYLLQKIGNTIDRENSGEQQNILTKLVSFGSEFKEFKELKDMLTGDEPPSSFEGGDWFSVRRENLYYLNNLLTDWQMITKKHTSFSVSDFYKSYENIKKSLKKMKKELKGDQESSSRGDPDSSATSHHQEPDRPIFERNKEEVHRWSSRHGPRKVHGLEHKVMSMERELVKRNIDAPFKVFGVVGVAGIGKTTLCQSIFGRQKVKEHFSPRIWVCLSKQPLEDAKNEKEIVVRILRCLGIEDEVISNAAQGDDALRRLILLLRLQLIGRRYLIVLDDVWNDVKFFHNLTQKEYLDENWGKELALAYGLPKGCGGTVISSSRSEALTKEILGKEANLQYLEPLIDEHCYEIFRDTVTGYDDDEVDFPEHLTELKSEILKRCDKLPLAARLLGEIAREKLPLKSKSPTTVSARGAQENQHDLPAVAQNLKGGMALQQSSLVPTQSFDD